MAKETKTQDAQIRPLAVATYRKHILFLYGAKLGRRERLFLSKSHDGTGFSRMHEAEIISERGKPEDLSACGDFHFASYGTEHYVSYSRSGSLGTKRVVARSKDLLRFEVVMATSSPSLSELALVSGHKHRFNFLAYCGGESIRAGVSRDMVDWHLSGDAIPPRRDRFDRGPLRVVSAQTVGRGILVIYETIEKGKEAGRVSLGAAVMHLDRPYFPMWRSEHPIWEKEISKGEDIRLIGSALSEDGLRLYWSSGGKLVSVPISRSVPGLYPSIGLSSSKLKREASNPILKPEPGHQWEREATFNPAAILLDGKVHLIYRAIGWDGVSVFGYASSASGHEIDDRLDGPVFRNLEFPGTVPAKARNFTGYFSGGSWSGCEDPRLTPIGDRIYMTYVAYDGWHPPGVALTSIAKDDFLKRNWKWKRPVLISRKGQIQKNWMLFPEKINGKFAILNSITPKVSIEYVDDLDREDLVIDSRKAPGKEDEGRWDNIVRGAGAPPIETEYGWLVLYHAMDKRDPNRYKVGAMILDRFHPERVVFRSDHPILEPAESYENEGAKAGVVYVCGAVIKDGTLFVYYGGADSVVCVATADIREFLDDIVRGAEKQEEELPRIEEHKQN